jgi:hypothetical protein
MGIRISSEHLSVNGSPPRRDPIHLGVPPDIHTQQRRRHDAYQLRGMPLAASLTSNRHRYNG